MMERNRGLNAMNLTEKTLLRHAVGWDRDRVRPGDALKVAVDWTLASEIAWKGMNRTYQALGRPPLKDKDRFYLALDHTVDRGTLATDPRVQELVQLSKSFAREADLSYFFDANTTIMHTEFFRQLVRPGEVVLGADSHTSSHGGMGAFAIGLGGADVVAAMVEGTTWVEVPEAIRVHYRGRLPFGLTGKDVILETLGTLRRNTVAFERAVEYTSDHPEDLTTDFRFTIANMTAELGGLNGIFAPDRRTLETMAVRSRPEFRQGGWWLEADEDAEYRERFDIDLGSLAPRLARPFSPDNVVPVDDALGEPLDGCFIGACTTTEEELVLAALVLARMLEAGLEFRPSPNRLVVPGSLEITRRLGERGLLEVYHRTGFRVGEPGCSMCIGIASDRARPGQVWLSSQNRNFPNRMGKGSIAWLASAVTVASSSAGMAIADPRPYLAAISPEELAALLPRPSGLGSIEPQEPEPRPRGATVAVGERVATAARGPITGRAQLFGDNVDTDAMIAGEFCHLTDLDELGARAFLHFRPDFNQRVRAGCDILVAGEGWGTGSSREQAVWALQGAGVRAVIAKSFAFIHKRNLINEALPFVVMKDEAFYAAVADGSPLHLDLAAGTVSVDGKGVFTGEPLSPLMQGIVEAGGLLAQVRGSLAARKAPGASLPGRDPEEVGFAPTRSEAR